ncbi:hypothetical protein KKH23_09475 [Patescibacteria group bacterium]|nr:hypothetical protein [Patescibacteria group bacterium]
MIELRPVEVPTTRPKIILPDWWLKFSNAFPDTLDHVKGKTVQVLKQQQVKHELSWIIKEACYKDVNLSNDDAGEKLYPDVADNIYEVLIGFKPGNYLCHVFFPAEYPIYRLDYPDMSPLISSASLKYLGAIKPEDSPVDNPIFKLYLVFKLKPIILRLYADDGVDYEKISLELTVNRCLMQEGVLPPGVTPKPIQYLDEIKWLSLGAGGA